MSPPPFATTRTGNISIGFRRLGSAWQKGTDTIVAWALENHFGVIDLNKASEGDLARISASGLRIGSVDLIDERFISADSGLRKSVLAEAAGYIKKCAAAGARIFFTIAIPADRNLTRQENFGYMIESFLALVPVLEQTDSRIAIEGWPGPGVVCCTPETYRTVFREIDSPRIGVNYDPSHLLRMGIDPLRFLKEFAGRVYHVHGKDTALSNDELYEYGHELPPTFAKGHGWGGASWRYTIPGHGQAPWVEIFRVLRESGYNGAVGIELEDENFNGTEEGEKCGLMRSQQFLQGC
jgi:sugar phosphate isomerase/epimerase